MQLAMCFLHFSLSNVLTSLGMVHNANPSALRKVKIRVKRKHYDADLAVIRICLPVSLVFNYFSEHFGNIFQWLVPQFLWDLCGKRDRPEEIEEKSNLLELSAAKTRRALGKGLIFPGPWDPYHWSHAVPS